MSQETDLEEKCDVYGEAPSSSLNSSPDLVHKLHAQDDFPDGGLRAWLVVLGSSCAAFSTFGHVNSFGVFQEYYQDVLLNSTSPSTIAWIGSTQTSLIFFPALISGHLFDTGHLHLPLLIASVNLVLCTLLIAECHEYWQFLLCQGIGVGVSCGVIYGPMTSIIAHWFKSRRSTALGIMSFASSIGATMFSVAFRNLHASVGFKWSMRIISFVLILILGIMNLTLRRRLPPIVVAGGLFNLKQFKSPAYSVYTASVFIAGLGLYTALIFIGASAPSQGASLHLSSYLVAIANAGSGVGRLSCGFLADQVGAMNVMTPALFLASILTFLWPHLRGTGALVSLALLYGTSVGGFVALLCAPMIALGGSTDVGRRTGAYLTVLSLCSLAGPPISGAIYHSTGGYSVVGIYAGSTMMVSVVLLILSRYIVLGRWRGRV